MKKLLRLFAFSSCVLVLLGFSLRDGRAMARSNDKAAIEALENKFNNAFKARDVDAIMACYAPGAGTFVFDVTPPREHPNWDSYRKDWEETFAAYPGPAGNAISDLDITVVGPVAYSHSIQSGFFTRKDGATKHMTVRVTDVYRKIGGKWLIVQEHVSVPVDMETGKADLLSRP